MQLLATDIPTAETLKLTSCASAGPLDPSLPPASLTETPLKRDDWMLMSSSTTVIVPTSTSRTPVPSGDDSFTEDYGDAPQARSLSDGVDFFSTLGTEVKRKMPASNPPEAQVH